MEIRSQLKICGFDGETLNMFQSAVYMEALGAPGIVLASKKTIGVLLRLNSVEGNDVPPISSAHAALTWGKALLPTSSTAKGEALR